MQQAYQSPFSSRYASKEMQVLFSQEHRAKLMRRVWLVLARSQRELGLPISQEQIKQMESKADSVDFEAIAAFERQLRHDVMAHLKAFAADCPLAAPILHLGATSCTITDNADILIIKQALELLRRRLLGTARALHRAAGLYKDLPLLGFTHFQPAQPTTLGKRLCLYLQDLLMDLEALNHLLEGLRPLGCKGATGTQASFLALFEGDGDKVKTLDIKLAQGLGFERPLAVSGQTYTRKIDYQLLSLLSGLAQSASKFAADLRLMAHMKEVEEPFETSQVGSSAMPYKRNPMRAERMTALARFLMGNAANAAHTAANQWLERSLDDSANRRLSLAEGCLAADGLLTLYENIVSGLVVYPKMMLQHLHRELPFLATENILMRAVIKGGDRQQLHERLRVHAQAAGQRIKEEGADNDLLDRIAGDAAFALTRAELDSLLNPRDYTGRAAQQAAEYLAGEAGVILAAHADIVGMDAEIKL